LPKIVYPFIAQTHALQVSDGGRGFLSFVMSEVKGLLDLSCDSIAEVPSEFPTKALDLEMVLDEDLRK